MSLSFTGLLQTAFIVLKLLGKISWSWWWVLAPTWISIIVYVLVIFLFAYLDTRNKWYP